MAAEVSQLSFVAQLVLFLAGFVLLAVAVLRPDLVAEAAGGRTTLVVGSAVLAGCAFLAGSLLVEPVGHPVLAGGRVAAAVAVGLGAVGGRAGAPRRLLGLGSVALVVAEVSRLAGPTAARAGWLVAGAALGAAALAVAARSIPARIAVGTAVIVAVTVAAVSVSVSVVIERNVEQEAVRRVAAQAEALAAVTATEPDTAASFAESMAFVLSETRNPRVVEALVGLADAPTDPRASAWRQVIEDSLRGLLTNLAVGDAAAYVTGGGVAVTAIGFAGDDAGRLAVSTHPVVAGALAAGELRASLARLPDGVAALAAAPVSSGQPPRMVGVVVAAVAVDGSYLELRRLPFPGASLTLVADGTVLARAGEAGTTATAVEVASRALTRLAPVEERTDTEVAAAVPLEAADGTPVAALVVAVPARQLAETRAELFRTLFVVALVAAAGALLVAVALGERIGGGVRRLTGVAERVRGGDLTARASPGGGDEVGVLAATFNEMADSVERLAGDLRATAEAEARVRSRLEAVVAGMGEALVAADAEGRIVEFNAAAERLTGVPAPAARGRPIGEVIRLAADGVDLTDRLSPGAGRWAGTAEVDGPGGAVPVAVSVGPVPGPDGTAAGVVAVLRDRRAEQQLERMKNEFIANIGHELRTPLTPIRGYAGMLARRDLPADRVRAFAGEIVSSAEQLERVVDQLLVFATVAAGALDLRPEPVPVADLLEEVAHRWRRRAGDRHRIVVRVTPGVPHAEADPRYLTQALDELVDNALKYSPDGGRIVLGAGPAENGSRPAVRITVTDPGVGIPGDRMEAVFAEFSQVDGSATRRFGGMGLGLALVSRIVRAHGGVVEVRSRPGRGTRVEVVVPAAPGAGGDR